MSDFKYKTSFNEYIIGCCSLPKMDFVEKSQIGSYFSSASLDALDSIIPKDIDLDKNIDLIATAFNAAVVNKFNKNGDGIDSATAIAIKDYFVHKPTNIEHKKQKVVGHIVSSAFSSIGANKILNDDEVRDSKDGFNISLGAVVYRTVNQAFADMLEQSEEDENYESNISASWELGFNDYVIALGNAGLQDAEIITEESKMEEFKKYLKAFDGPGTMDDGTEVNRLIVGDVFPLGIGYTMNPAADVRGVHVKKLEKQDLEEQESESSKIFNKKHSQKQKNTVITLQRENSHKTMDAQDIINKLEEVASTQKFSEEAVANISKIVRDAIKEKSEEYVKEKETLANEKKEFEDRESAMKTEALEVKEQLEIAQKEINELKSIAEEAKAKETFNSRMDVIDSTYDINDEDRKVLASELQKLDISDESFTDYQEKISVMWKHKNKEIIEASEKEVQKRIDEEVERKLAELSEANVKATDDQEAQASETNQEDEKVLEQALENAEAVSSEVTSNNGETSEKEMSLREKFQSLFNRDNIKVTY